jgi:hypothetical protein
MLHNRAMSPDRRASHGPPPRGRAAALLLGAGLALAGCDKRQPEAGAPPTLQQGQRSVTTEASPFRAAYETLAALPADSELTGLRATAALSRLQGQVRPSDLALAIPLAKLAGHSRSAVRATSIALIGELAAATGGSTLPPEARDALLAGMGDDEEHVRLEATRAASPLRDDAVRGAMLERLSDASSMVRFHALQALHASGALQPGTRARSRALPLRDDPDRLVRDLARTVLTD